MVVTYENPENREAKKINRTPIGTPQPPGPATTQNNRRTTQNKTLSVALKKSGFARGAQVESWTLIPYSQSSNWFQLHNSPMSTAFNCNCTATLFSRWFCASNSWFPLGSSLSF